MPLPSKSDLQTLDIVYLGQPFVQVEAKSLDTKTLDVVYLGRPFVAKGIGAGSVVYVKVNGVWVESTNIYVKISGVWEQGTMYGNAGGIWRF